ncbi:MAG: translocase, partial [Planctomycetaceae bacterium]
MSIASQLFHYVKSGFHPATARRSRWRSMALDIIRRSELLVTLSDEDLLTRGRRLRWDARAGTPLADLLPDAYALVRESARRCLGIQHFPVQIMGAIAMFE